MEVLATIAAIASAIAALAAWQLTLRSGLEMIRPELVLEYQFIQPNLLLIVALRNVGKGSGIGIYMNMINPSGTVFMPSHHESFLPAGEKRSIPLEVNLNWDKARTVDEVKYMDADIFLEYFDVWNNKYRIRYEFNILGIITSPGVVADFRYRLVRHRPTRISWMKIWYDQHSAGI